MGRSLFTVFTSRRNSKMKISATSNCKVFCDADLATGRSKLATLLTAAKIQVEVR
jgi:hypothetical protein